MSLTKHKLTNLCFMFVLLVWHINLRSPYNGWTGYKTFYVSGILTNIKCSTYPVFSWISGGYTGCIFDRSSGIRSGSIFSWIWYFVDFLFLIYPVFGRVLYSLALIKGWWRPHIRCIPIPNPVGSSSWNGKVELSPIFFPVCHTWPVS